MRKTRGIPSHPKLRGEWAELQFMARAAGQGFRISRPISDCYRYDLVVEHELGFHRVQVKATSQQQKSFGYTCPFSYMSGSRVYTADEVDFLAVYVIPEDVWYIIPARVIRGAAVYVNPRTHSSRNQYEQYREAWRLLRRPGRFNINACADPEWADPPSPECHPPAP